MAWDKAGGEALGLRPGSAYHQALLRSLGSDGDTAVLNLGGVANVTWWDGADTLIAFDTGPANAPINDFVKAHGRGDMDRDGIRNKHDRDIDGDGVANRRDRFPEDRRRS